MAHDAASFLGMWTLMMTVMMLPSLVPMLRRYRQAMNARGGNRSAGLTVLVGVGYLSVWTSLGLVALLLMQVPAIAQAGPRAIGVVMVIAGALQFTPWKAHQLACCRRAASAGSSGNEVPLALRHGLRLGFHCTCCCAGSTAILLVGGFMDARAMILATAAITAERLAPSGEQVARAIGVGVVAAGLWLFARNGIGIHPDHFPNVTIGILETAAEHETVIVRRNTATPPVCRLGAASAKLAGLISTRRNAISHPSRSCAAVRCGSDDAACAVPWLLFAESARG